MFTIQLDFFAPLPHEHEPWDDEADAPAAILKQVCDALSPFMKFHVGGFGVEDWRPYPITDLPVLLDDLPQEMTAMGEGRPFSLSFVEQGLECRIDCTVVGDVVQATMYAFGSFRPPLSEECLSLHDITAMLDSCLAAFVGAALSCYPELLRNPQFHAWLEQAPAWSKAAALLAPHQTNP